MNKFIENIQSSYASAHRSYHDYTDWEEAEWNAIEKAEQSASDEMDSLRQSLEVTTGALKFCQIHLKSMENYSIVSGALYQIDEALKKLGDINK